MTTVDDFVEKYYRQVITGIKQDVIDDLKQHDNPGSFPVFNVTLSLEGDIDSGTVDRLLRHNLPPAFSEMSLDMKNQGYSKTTQLVACAKLYNRFYAAELEETLKWMEKTSSSDKS